VRSRRDVRRVQLVCWSPYLPERACFKRREPAGNSRVSALKKNDSKWTGSSQKEDLSKTHGEGDRVWKLLEDQRDWYSNS